MRQTSGVLVLFLICVVSLNAQTPIYWAKDYIRDGSGGTIAIAVPPPPSFASITSGPTSVQLAWTAPEKAQGGPDVAGYRIFRGASVAATVGTGTSFTDVALQPDTQYTYAIAALDLAGNQSAPSAPVTIRTLSAKP